MEYTIVKCSPRALKKIDEADEGKPAIELKAASKLAYPFNELGVGYSLTMPIDGINEVSLRNSVCSFAKRNGLKFCVLKHADFGIFEVARVK